MTESSEGVVSTAAPTGVERRGVSLGVLIVNQLLAGIGVSSGIAVAALLVQELTGATVLAGLAQTSSVLGAGVTAIPLARIAVRRGRHMSLGIAYATSFIGAFLVLVAAVSHVVPLVFLGLACFGVSSAAGLQARFAATEIAGPGYEARWMSLVLWATTLGSVTGPNLSSIGNGFGIALGLPPLVGPFLFSGASFATSALLVVALLRLPRAGRLATDTADDTASAATEHVGSWRALTIAVSEPRARFALLAIVCSHTVMVSVMVMTPVHMHDHGLSLALVGLVISIHIIGMYGASPVMGWLTDRIGPARVIVVGLAILVTATVIGVFAGGSMVLIPLGLGLLGLGWSAGLIGGSTLLTTAVDPSIRVPLQGASDAAMNLAAAIASAFSGLVLGLGGFPAVNVVAMCVLVPLAVAAVPAFRTLAAKAPAHAD